MMIHKIFHFLTLLVIVVTLVNLMSRPIDASVVGEYYLQNFNGYSHGQTNFSWYDEGVTWGSIHCNDYEYSCAYQNSYRMNMSPTSANAYTWLNFTQPTTFINYSWISILTGTSTTYILYMFNSMGTRLFYMYCNNGAGTHEFRLYGKTNATILHSHLGAGNINYSGIMKFEFSQSNNSIHFNKTSNVGVDYSLHEWYNVGSDYDSMVHLKIFGSTVAGSTLYNRYDNIYFLKGSLYQWEIDTGSSFGAVTTSYTSIYSTSLTAETATTSPYTIIEKLPRHMQGGLFVGQFAWSIMKTCDLTKMTILLHLANEDFGYYDNVYAFEDYWVLVWRNINTTFNGNSLLIELLITGTSLPTTFSYPVYQGDVDSDGYIDFYESLGNISTVLQHFDGVYDGTNYYNTKEPLYKIWTYDYLLYNDISFRLFDDLTGTPLSFYTIDYEHFPVTEDNYVIGSIYITSGSLFNELVYTKHYFERITEFIDGSCYFYNGQAGNITVYSYTMHEPVGEVNGVPTTWQITNNTEVLWNGLGYDIYLRRIGQPEEEPFNSSYYIGLYGDFFVEFLGQETPHYYSVGDSPYIVYNLSDTYLNGTSRRYRVNIMSGATEIYGFFITFPYNETEINDTEKIDGMRFLYPSNYYLVVYAYNETQRNETILLYVSHSIYVSSIPAEDTGGGDSQQQEETQYMTLYGIIGVMAAGIACAVLIGHPIGFIAGGGVTAYVFSNITLGNMTLLPAGVGSGIIVVLVIVAVILFLVR